MTFPKKKSLLAQFFQPHLSPAPISHPPLACPREPPSQATGSIRNSSPLSKSIAVPAKTLRQLPAGSASMGNKKQQNHLAHFYLNGIYDIWMGCMIFRIYGLLVYNLYMKQDCSWQPRYNELNRLHIDLNKHIFFIHMPDWLVVSNPLKHISQLGWLFQVYGNIKHVPNYQPADHSGAWFRSRYLCLPLWWQWSLPELEGQPCYTLLVGFTKGATQRRYSNWPFGNPLKMGVSRGKRPN